MTKRCRGFGREAHESPTSEFARNRAANDGLQRLCRACHAESMRAYRERCVSRSVGEVAARQGVVKRCRRCSSAGREPIRSIDDFYTARDQPDGKRPHCKDCVRELRWKSYGIVGMTIERFDQMLRDQNYRCAIPACRAPSARTLDVDHCHETGEVRGLLCKSCNSALSQQRGIEVLKGLVAYLEVHRRAARE